MEPGRTEPALDRASPPAERNPDEGSVIARRFYTELCPLSGRPSRRVFRGPDESLRECLSPHPEPARSPDCETRFPNLYGRALGSKNRRGDSEESLTPGMG